MSEYIGTVGSRVSFEAVYKKYSEYKTHFTFYGETHAVYQLEDADGNRIVWDTTSGFIEDKKMERDRNGMLPIIWEGAKLLVKATVKDHSEYKGVKQTKISRPTFTLIENGKNPAEAAKAKEEAKARKKQEQLDSIKEGDFVWRMPYKQYKEHYSDCETVCDSYEKHEDAMGRTISPPTIEVIIRAGRLKNSGTRGQHFYGFVFAPSAGCEDGVVFRAVSEENARKQLLKKNPDCKDWVCVKIYEHRRGR